MRLSAQAFVVVAVSYVATGCVTAPTAVATLKTDPGASGPSPVPRAEEPRAGERPTELDVAVSDAFGRRLVGPMQLPNFGSCLASAGLGEQGHVLFERGGEEGANGYVALLDSDGLEARTIECLTRTIAEHQDLMTLPRRTIWYLSLRTPLSSVGE